MNRLTNTDEAKSYKEIIKIQDKIYGAHPSLLRYVKLAAYEDTGLEPEEIKNTSELIEICATQFKNLKQYKDLEEQGLLIKLPCKVGDTVYVNKNCLNDWYCLLESKRYTRCEVIGVKKTKKQLLLNLKPLTERTANTRYHVFFSFSAIGKTVFLTQEEAEKALEAHQ